MVINTAQEAANWPHSSVQHPTLLRTLRRYPMSAVDRHHLEAYKVAYAQCGMSYSIHYTNSVVTTTLVLQERMPSPKCATYLRSSIRSRRPISATTRKDLGQFKLQATSATGTLHCQTARRGLAGSPSQSTFSQAYALQSQYKASHCLSHPTPTRASRPRMARGQSWSPSYDARISHLAISRSGRARQEVHAACYATPKEDDSRTPRAAHPSAAA